MEFVPLKDEDVDGTFEPVWTVQGILRMPRQDRKPGADGLLPLRRWLVPDAHRWGDVPGFPDFLWDATKLSPGAVRPMTAEERSAYLNGKSSDAAESRGMELVVLPESLSIRVDGKVVSLSAREHELLVRTIDEGPLSHGEAALYLEAVKSKSPGAVPGFVDAAAVHDHRKSILAKVEREAGRQARVLVGEAFRSRSEELIYDASVLPVRTEGPGGK